MVPEGGGELYGPGPWAGGMHSHFRGEELVSFMINFTPSGRSDLHRNLRTLQFSSEGRSPPKLHLGDRAVCTEKVGPACLPFLSPWSPGSLFIAGL